MRISSVSAIAFVIMLLFFAAAACAPVEMKKLPAQSPGSYKFVSQQNGFKISVDPYKEEGRLKEYFGCDLLSRGVFPIAVAIENLNASGGYILINDKMFLVMKSSDPKGGYNAESQDGAKPVELRGGPTSGSVDAGGALATASTIFFPLLIPAAILTYSGLNQMENETAIRKNLEQNRIVPKTLYPGDSQHGFLYFKINDKKDIEHIQGVNINLKSLPTDQVLTLNIQMIAK
jgi:hypothetical protein